MDAVSPALALVIRLWAIEPMTLASKCFGWVRILSVNFRALQALHRIREVDRSGEYRP
jgi:hypothetical protein